MGTSFDIAKKLGLIPKYGKIIAYELPTGMANPDPIKAKSLLTAICSDVRGLHLKTFNVISYSLGTYPAFFISNTFHVKKLVSVVPGSKLGASIYNGIATQEIKKRAIKLGYTSSLDYDSCIHDTNPIENLKNLPQDIEIHLATHDFFIPTIYGEELIRELIKNRTIKVLRYHNKGHVLTIKSFGRNNPY